MKNVEISYAARETISKILPMFGSDNAGEVFNAVKAVQRVLKKEKLDYNDFSRYILQKENSRSDNARNPFDDGYKYKESQWREPPKKEKKDKSKPDYGFANEPGEDWIEKVEEIKKNIHRYSHKEREFIESIEEWVGSGSIPTEKQEKWLKDLYARAQFYNGYYK